MDRNLKHILCVDDEADILEVACMCLETVGDFQVSRCGSGQEAIQKVDQINPDIILLDVMMPEMDGPSTLKILKQMESLKDVPIVFMTARVQALEVQQYIAMGASAVIEKPFDPMMLSDQVAQIWRHFHGR